MVYIIHKYITDIQILDIKYDRHDQLVSPIVLYKNWTRKMSESPNDQKSCYLCI